jgi:hypothetical protein
VEWNGKQQQGRAFPATFAWKGAPMLGFVPWIDGA